MLLKYIYLKLVPQNCENFSLNYEIKSLKTPTKVIIDQNKVSRRHWIKLNKYYINLSIWDEPNYNDTNIESIYYCRIFVRHPMF